MDYDGDGALDAYAIELESKWLQRLSQSNPEIIGQMPRGQKSRPLRST